MKEPEIPNNERDRIKELESYSILDTLSEVDYDDLTAIAAEICGTPISLISFIDSDRQWFKSHHGVDETETPREIAFCAHAINDQENVMMIPDMRKDDRFHDNPLVTGDHSVAFYAGVPLVSDNGFPLGTLCVIDQKPKKLSEGQLKSLRALGRQAMSLLSLRKTKQTLEKTLENLEDKNQDLERFAFIAAHDLKSPLIGINSLSQLISENHGSHLDEDGKEMIHLITKSSDKLKNLIDGLLDYSKCESVLKEKKTQITLEVLIKDIAGLFATENALSLKLVSSISTVETNRTALEQVLINLITNAIKYNDKQNIEIEIGVSASSTHYEFYVKDNGPGIPEEHQDSIFEIFKVMSAEDRFGKPGNGIGLASVKKVVESSGGAIKVKSKPNEGAKFLFTLEN